jgi:hypothetical protein
MAAFVMLNPSTADAAALDRTVRRCLGFAQSWGCGGLLVLNAFALRATNPAQLKYHPSPVGPHNDAVIRAELDRLQPRPVVAAWGNNGAFKGREVAMLLLLGGCATALKVTRGGHPGHPLYVRKDAQPVPYP